MKFVNAVKKLLGRGALVPTGIILHATAGKSGQSSVEWLSKIGLGYHFIIERNGDIIVGVPKEQKAFHAGKSRGWDGPNCNNYTLSISFANMDDGEQLTSAQNKTVEELVAELVRKVPTLRFISTHKKVSPGRKTDPSAWTFKDSTFCGLRVW